MARLKAEADAEHATRRLAVAQEQIAEYAQQREGEAGALLGEVQAVEQALTSALEQAGTAADAAVAGASGSSSSLAELSARVKARLCCLVPALAPWPVLALVGAPSWGGRRPCMCDACRP